MNQEPEKGGTESREARKWAMICHIISLVGLLANGIGFVIAPLIVWLLKREDDPFIDKSGKEIINFQITMIIAMLIAGLLSFVIIGIPLMIIVGIMMVVFPIVGAVKASDGILYHYPLTIRFIK